MVDTESTGLKIDGHIGTWYAIGTATYNGKNVYLLEHEAFGDEAACLIIDENLDVLLDDVWNGFEDYEYYLESVE